MVHFYETAHQTIVWGSVTVVHVGFEDFLQVNSYSFAGSQNC